MRKIILLATMALLGMRPSGSAAVSLAPLGPVTIQLSSMQQGLDFALVSSKTNQTTTSTNITSTYKSTVTNSAALTQDVLNALANSFNTNLPAGAKLACNAVGFYVVDSTGTNIILNASSVLAFDFEDSVVTGLATQTTLKNSAGTQFSNTENSTQTFDATLSYDDHSLSTADGTHTEFQLHGLLLLKRTSKNNLLKATYTFTGSGSGEVRDQDRIIKGSVSGKGSQKLILE